MLEVFKQLFTSKDNVTYSLTKLLGVLAAGEMLYKFGVAEVVDYVGFAAGVAAIMAALVAKTYVEGKGKEGE